MARVFLSYDHDDAERAAPIASALEKGGHSVWWDRHIKGGAEYNDEIEAAVRKADAVVVLWSERSVRSAWVRDEAAEGRDQGKLVPVSIDAAKPPMGFRQFQTIDLSRSNRGPSGALLRQLLDSIDAVGGTSRASTSPPVAMPARRFGWSGWRIGVASAVLAILAVAAVIAWIWRSQPALAVVSVAASDSAPGSQALSRDLVVKLGSLAHVAEGKWQLADPQMAGSNPDFLFRVAETGSRTQPEASLVLLDVKANNVLWSRGFTPSNATEADLRLQLSLTAGRVLGCALEARETGGLPADLSKRFLAGCAEAAEISNNEPEKIAGIMRMIVDRQPRFAPAWARLLLADINLVDVAEVGNTGLNEARRTMAKDSETAQKIAPHLPEIKLAQIRLLSPHDYAGALEGLEKAKAEAPENPEVWLFEIQKLMGVGRMAAAIESARRAAELDPLSPAATTQLIMTLAHGGRIDLARQELQRAERRWAGTAALEDAQWAFHLRYGDPMIAKAMLRANADTELYFRARLEPTPQNVNAVVEDIQHFEQQIERGGVYGYSIQALGEFHKTEEAFAWLNRARPSRVAAFSYLLFRPALAEVRRDPRFMVVAKRAGLLDYWQKSGKWPDFCFEPDFPYDCKGEAAKLLG